MSLFHRARKTDITQEVAQLRSLREDLAETIAELKVTSRILENKAQLVRDRDQNDGNSGDDND